MINDILIAICAQYHAHSLVKRCLVPASIAHDKSSKVHSLVSVIAFARLATGSGGSISAWSRRTE
eukprot:359469-Chlamydomonas_euryale.AAC.15